MIIKIINRYDNTKKIIDNIYELDRTKYTLDNIQDILMKSRNIESYLYGNSQDKTTGNSLCVLLRLTRQNAYGCHPLMLVLVDTIDYDISMITVYIMNDNGVTIERIDI